ncbi:MAG: hypothetical protein CBB92_11270 [Flammeovirgaceae bacterium TMED32]|nr:MAG: hypothetical protein CBB92_11270 [Flammeovirgaceae bacterium TMED32]|tara:strand:- start:2414 stop:2929 length:516 start_codon:yes stop_codon:yes gene_type:complete
MQTLQKITTEFIESEDRFRLSAESEDGASLQFWLTQRLLVRLISHCINWLEKTSTPISKVAADVKNRSDVQNFVQRSAQTSLASVKAVCADKNTPGFLIERIDIKLGDKNIAIIFNENGANYVLNLTDQHLRQWLSILFTLWQGAEWPSSVWPTWMTETNDEISSGTSPIH